MQRQSFSRYSHELLIAHLILLAALYGTLHVVASADSANTVHRNHVFLFGAYGDGGGNHASRDFPNDASGAPNSGARYVQLSNGSRFVCDTTAVYADAPASTMDIPLNFVMQSVVTALKQSDMPCTHVAEEQYSTVLCWDREVRLNSLVRNTSRILGRREETAAAVDYHNSSDAFGPYVSTVYGDGEACPYDEGKRTETELRFYCRHTTFENPVPFLTLHEASQCRFVLRIMSNKFCVLPPLDHAVETETVRCRMLE